MYVVLIAVSIVLLAGVRYTERKLDDQVAEHKLRFTGEIKNAPPMVAFTTVALGSFRGLVADLLWLRSNSLQQKGNYFEMVQLARWSSACPLDRRSAAELLRSNIVSCLEYVLQYIRHLFGVSRPLEMGE